MLPPRCLVSISFVLAISLVLALRPSAAGARQLTPGKVRSTDRARSMPARAGQAVSVRVNRLSGKVRQLSGEVATRWRAWRQNQDRLGSMEKNVPWYVKEQGGRLRSDETRMRLAHEVYRDPHATRGQKRRALRVMRSRYAHTLHLSSFGNAHTVRHGWLGVAHRSLAEDQAVRERAGVPLRLLVRPQPEDTLRNRIAPLGSTGTVRRKLGEFGTILKAVRGRSR